MGHLGKRERVARKSRRRSRWTTIMFFCKRESEGITLKLGSKKAKAHALLFDDKCPYHGWCGRCRKVKAKACAGESPVGLLATPFYKT